jgi:curved DNA-binding protein CbpA
MGNSASSQMFPGAHIRIYQNIILIRDPVKRVEMIETLLAGPEYVQSAKKAGIYSALLMYVTRVQKGQRPDLLPGEGSQARPVQQQQQQTQITRREEKPRNAYTQLSKANGKEKAIGYFQSSLEVLGLEEEVALTEEALTKAYKRAALRTHPDKGGSEEKFEAVTRAYAYLNEILRRIHGGRTKASVVEAPTAIQETRGEDAKAWKQAEPIRLNPKKLDVNAFNQMFEQTRIPDPDDDGYGDWLTNKNDGKEAGSKFSGKFNRDVFNKMFEEQARREGGPTTQLMTLTPQAMTLAPTSGVELGRGKSDSYTAPANANLKYTDLKQAYTLENTISGQVSNVRVEHRDIKDYKAARSRAPEPMLDHESAAIAEAERQAAERERQRQLRVAQEGMFANEYFERMKRLVITNQ